MFLASGVVPTPINPEDLCQKHRLLFDHLKSQSPDFHVMLHGYCIKLLQSSPIRTNFDLDEESKDDCFPLVCFEKIFAWIAEQKGGSDQKQKLLMAIEVVVPSSIVSIAFVR